MPAVEIYTKRTCPFCIRALSLLKEKGIAFQEYEISFDSSKRDEMIKRADGRMTVPQIFIDDVGIGGCDDLYSLDEKGELDTLLQQA